MHSESTALTAAGPKHTDAPGETLCLQFANTAESDDNRLADYHDLISWCRREGALSEEVASRLLEDAARQPRRAGHVFRKAVALRRTVNSVFSAAAAQRTPSETDLRSLNRAVVEALKHLRIVQTAVGFGWEWEEAKTSLEFPLWLVARSAADLITSERQVRIQQCESADCSWLFLDRSKNRSRRWCDMAECGNREKARRSRARKQAGA